jgi:hypothetical protein
MSAVHSELLHAPGMHEEGLMLREVMPTSQHSQQDDDSLFERMSIIQALVDDHERAIEELLRHVTDYRREIWTLNEEHADLLYLIHEET